MTGTLIGTVHVMLPFLVLPVYGSMIAIDRDYLNAAANLGAGPVRSFWAVFFPLSLPGLLTGALGQTRSVRCAADCYGCTAARWG